MIISKTPYRISFFGGGSDYPVWYNKNGGRVLSATIDKYIYISCRNLPPFFKHKYRIVWSRLEEVKKINEIKHTAVRDILKYYKFKDGIEIHYDGDLPARSGMGSSSVFVVGLTNLLNCYLKRSVNKEKLAKQSIFFEQKLLNEAVGSQDQIAASYGGFNKIIFKKGGSFSIKKINCSKKRFDDLNKNLILIYTGIKRNAHDIARNYINNLINSKRRHILEIVNFVDEGEKVLESDNVSDFGRLLHESWLQKKSLSKHISNNKIDDIYERAMKNGALGGKLLGAGAGGFFLFYVPYYRQKDLLKNFKKLTTVPFKFSDEGSKIIFNSYKK